MEKYRFNKYFERIFDKPQESQEGERNRARDVAIFLTLIGKEAASKVLKYLKEEEIELIIQEMSKLNGKPIPKEEINRIMKEFLNEIKEAQLNRLGGIEYVREVLKEAFGEEKAEEVLRKTSQKDPKELFSFLNQVDLESLATALKGEHPQILAMIIANIKPKNAAIILKHLPDEERTEVIKRIATTESISPFMMEKLAEALKKKIEHISKVHASQIDGQKRTADILSYLDRETEEKILQEIASFDKELAKSIREKMFTFEDIKNLDDEDIRTIIEHIDLTTLAKALKAAEVSIVEKFLKNMSKNQKRDLLEEMEFLGALKLKEIQKARDEILSKIRKLYEENLIDIKRKP